MLSCDAKTGATPTVPRIISILADGIAVLSDVGC
jgi:hypothetical protein